MYKARMADLARIYGTLTNWTLLSIVEYSLCSGLIRTPSPEPYGKAFTEKETVQLHTMGGTLIRAMVIKTCRATRT
jgi:hypothetical protein